MSIIRKTYNALYKKNVLDGLSNGLLRILRTLRPAFGCRLSREDNWIGEASVFTIAPETTTMRRHGISLSTPLVPTPNKGNKKELDLERVWVVIADPMNPLDLTVKQLKRAAAIKDHIEQLNKQLSSLLGPPAKKKRLMSSAVKRKIATSQKARWANLRRAKSAARSSSSVKKKVSAATRAKLRAKLKAYWAAKKRKAR